MAASKRQLNTITRKLEDFQKDRQALQEAIDVFAGNVTALVNTWLKSQGKHGPHFQEMIGFLANSSGYIVQKAEEIEAKGGEGNADGAPSSSSTSSSITSPPTSSSSTASPHLAGTSTQVSELSEQLKKLTTRFDGLSDQFSSSLQEYTQNRSKDRGQIKKLEDRMNEVENSVHDMSVDLSKVDKKVKKYDEKIGDLDKKVGSIEERQSVLEKEKEKESDLIRNIQRKIQQNESDHRMLEDLAERVEKIEKEKERVDVQIQRLNTLEDHLRGIEKEREDNTKEVSRMLRQNEMNTLKIKLGEMTRDLTACNSKVDSFEKRLHPVLGFTACIRDRVTILTKDTVVKEFTHIVCNKGNHYSPTTGVFTAPVDGLYMVALTHQQFGSGTVWLQVIYERVSPGPVSEREKLVCVTWTNKDCTNCSDMSVVEMTGGDQLYVKVIRGGRIDFPSGFSCFLIG